MVAPAHGGRDIRAHKTDRATAHRTSYAYPGADYTPEQEEYIQAVAAYQKKHKVKFLASTDYLRILLTLGYAKQQPPIR